MRLLRRHPAVTLPLLAALAFVGAACSRQPIPLAHEPPADRAPATAAFGSTQIFRPGKTVTFTDGLTVTLKNINDSRCRANVQCIWAGELAPELVLRGGDVGDNDQTVLLGTTTAKEKTVSGYVLALSDASKETATLVVSKTGGVTDSAPAGESGVRGMVRMGPTCPVERMPPDPNCADRPLAATFSIGTRSGAHAATVSSAADGTFSIKLPPGAYVVSLQSAGSMPSMAPQEFTVPARGYVELALSLDSGIR